MMRTTLTIEESIGKTLKKLAHDSGKPFKQVVNETLLLGLSNQETPKARPYRLEPASLGRPAAHLNLDKALELADSLEDQAIAEKMEQRK